MLARANTGTVLGIDALSVTVETESNHGIPKWTLIGLAKGAARESIDRVKTAIAACDISIAVDNAHFGLTEARLGLAPAVISPYVIRAIGEQYARRYFLSGERFDTQTAVQISLVQQSVPPDQLDDAVEEIIKQLLESGPLAVAHCKQLVFEVAGHNAESQKNADKVTASLIARLRVSAEGQEGLAAFLEKRKPDWTNNS